MSKQSLSIGFVLAISACAQAPPIEPARVDSIRRGMQAQEVDRHLGDQPVRSAGFTSDGDSYVANLYAVYGGVEPDMRVSCTPRGCSSIEGTRPVTQDYVLILDEAGTVVTGGFAGEFNDVDKAPLLIQEALSALGIH